jgi:hypothetical protein
MAELVVASDLDADEEPPFATECVLRAAWESASETARQPNGVVRSVPWDAFSEPMHRREHSADVVQGLVQRVLASALVADSAPEALVSSQPECTQFIRRFLPGVVEAHPVDGTPVNAVKWDTVRDDMSNIIQHIELARRHPGDRLEADCTRGISGSSADGYSEVGPGASRYQPVTTRAGSRMWALCFGEPGGAVTTLCASYPMQLLVRIDAGRAALIYDAFDHKPTPHSAMAATPAELRRVEALLKRAQRSPAFRITAFAGLPTPPPPPPEDLPHEERCRAYEPEMLAPLVDWERFKASAMRRVRFPLSSVCGARLVIHDFPRPAAALPAAEGRLPLAQLGQFGDPDDPYSNGYGGTARAATGAEASGAELEPLGVLVLELRGTGAECGCSYAATQCWPLSQVARARVATSDWTPASAASRATRHYIIGDASEMKELANALAAASDHMRSLLVQQPSDDVAARALNSLGGPVAVLRPEQIQRVRQLSQLAAAATAETAAAVTATEPAPMDTGSSSAAAGSVPRGFESCNDVHAFLRRCGVTDPAAANPCLKAALLNGAVRVPASLLHAPDARPFLDTLLLEGSCACCGQTLRCTVREALSQATSGGDYEDGGPGAAIFCRSCGLGENGNYITGLCLGQPAFDSGKGHNHCTRCPDFGQCIGDYREAHCGRCGNHYYRGLVGGRCSCRGGGSSMMEMDDYDGGMYGGSDSDDSDGGRRDQQGSGVGGSGDIDLRLPPADDCWNGRLQGAADFEADAHVAALERAAKDLQWLLGLPEQAQTSLLNLVAVTGGESDYTGGDILRDLRRARDTPTARLQAISAMLSTARTLRDEE